MLDKISICLVSINAYPLFNQSSDASFGGAELQIYLISKYLAQDDHYSVSVIVGDFGQASVEVIDNVRLLKSHSRGGGLIKRLFAPFQLFFAIKKASPHVLIQRASGPETGICAFYARVRNIRFIYSIAHDAETVGKSVASQHPLYSRMYNFGLKRADVIVVQSDFQRQSLVKMNRRLASRSEVIRNSIEVTGDVIECDRKYILWIARAKDWKRPELFIKLANAFPDEQFVMVMPVSDQTDKMAAVQKLAQNTQNINFKLSVHFSESQDLFSRSKVFVNTSNWEGFPNTFLQAGISATPLLSLVVDPDGFIQSNHCGFVCGDNVENLTSQLRLMLEDDELWQTLSQNCHHYVLDSHDIKTNIDQWKKLIAA